MAIRAFGLSLDPSICRLYIDDDSDLEQIPCMSSNFIRKKSD